MHARIAYINYTKKLRIFNILNYFCVVYKLPADGIMKAGDKLCVFQVLDHAPCIESLIVCSDIQSCRHRYFWVINWLAAEGDRLLWDWIEMSDTLKYVYFEYWCHKYYCIKLRGDIEGFMKLKSLKTSLRAYNSLP